MGLVARVNKISSDLSEDVFGEMGLLNCEPVKIELAQDAVPYSITTPRRVPFPLLPKVEKEIKRMLKLGIIEEVTEPTDWCAPMVPAPKRNKDEVRVCVDLKRLNKGVKRERYILPTLDGITPKLAGAKVFSTLDASRQVLGLINYVGKFLPGLSTVLHPLSNLLKKETVWAWGELQEQAFNKAKAMLVAAPELCYNDAGRSTVVSADASSYGLGAALLQVGLSR